MPQRLTDDELREAILLAEGGHWPAPPSRGLHQTVVALATDLLEARAERDRALESGQERVLGLELDVQEAGIIVIVLDDWFAQGFPPNSGIAPRRVAAVRDRLSKVLS